MGTQVLWEGQLDGYKFRMVASLNWCIYRLQKFDVKSNEWHYFRGPSSKAKQIFETIKKEIEKKGSK